MSTGKNKVGLFDMKSLFKAAVRTPILPPTAAFLSLRTKLRAGKAFILHRGILVFLLSFTALNCFATSLSFVGNGSFSVVGNTVVLQANEILNNEFFGISGTIRLELWAFSSPYPGTTFGYKLASYFLGQLNGGYYFYNINSGPIPFALPPPGTWYFSLQAREYVGGGGDGYVTRDYINFSSPERVAGGAIFGDEQIKGLTSWQLAGTTVNLSVAQVDNICNLGVSGSLRLDLWATASPYAGGTISGYVFGSVPLNPLTGGYVYNNISQTVTYYPPPDGVYDVTLTLSEYHNGSYVIVDYLTYASLLLVGIPAAPVANGATGISASGFTANWNGASGATGYALDVSTSGSFTSYVGGYQDLNVGSALSQSVSGLTQGTTYYYRVRAYNAVGASGNSSTIAVTLPCTYTITTSSSGGGTTSGGGIINCGSTVTVTATPTAGYQFVNWTESGSPVSSSASYQFIANGDRSLVAHFLDVQRPTVSTTTPGANARFTNNAVVTIQGTAADNSQVSAVNYRLNGASWAPAIGSSAWQTTVTLVPGTNAFQVFSVDSSGNNSLTNSQNIILVLTAPIVVQTNGAGTVSPNYNGQMLEIGQSYSMTATASAGFIFKNWTGSVPTNGPTVKFIMASNLVLTANFADIQKPTVSITNPATAKTYTNSQMVAISATASDNVGVTNVEFYDNSTFQGNDSTSPYAYDWSFTASNNGTHAWTARAYDSAGNVSTSSAVALTVSIDITPPTVVISTPTNGQVLATASLTVTGTATDPGSPTSGLNLVQVRFNGGSWSNATGTTSWTRAVVLSACGNTIEARSLDKTGNYSSIASNFVTYTPVNTVPNTPTNLSPPSGAANVSVTPTLQASAFTDPDPICVGDTHTASQWQVLSVGGTTVADSGTDTVNKASWTLPSNKLYYGSNYQWQVRYRDSRNGWSSYSARTWFTNGGPVLTGTKQSINMVFTWPTNSLGFRLQWSTNLGSPNWSNATPSSVIVNGQYAVTNNMTNNFKFYRLKK